LAREFKPAEIIEMGTGIGISTAYLAKACPGSRVITIEGDKEKMAYAARALVQMGLENVFMKVGSFNEILPDILLHAKHPVMVFIDGDHSYVKTLEYFGEIKKYATKETIIIFDDIRWSEGMERAWCAIKQDKDTVLCIDLFFMGIVFFRGGMPKQDFVINF
jgi:predicted O-methyltransferase YrrM